MSPNMLVPNRRQKKNSIKNYFKKDSTHPQKPRVRGCIARYGLVAEEVAFCTALGSHPDAMRRPSVLFPKRPPARATAPPGQTVGPNGLVNRSAINRMGPDPNPSVFRGLWGSLEHLDGMKKQVIQSSAVE